MMYNWEKINREVVANNKLFPFNYYKLVQTLEVTKSEDKVIFLRHGYRFSNTLNLMLQSEKEKSVDF